MSDISMYELLGSPNSQVVADRLLDHSADLASALGGEGAASFNVGLALSSWVTNMGGGGRQNIVIMGDSNVEHLPATPTRWAQLLKADLLTLSTLSDGGEGFRHLGLAEWTRSGVWDITGEYPDLNRAENPNFTGTAYDLAPNGYGFQGADTANVMTWTKPGTFGAHDRFVVYASDDDSVLQSPEYSLNGGAFTASGVDMSINTGKRLAKSPDIVGTVTTTLRLRSPNIFATHVDGVAFYNGTAGCIVHNLGTGAGSVKQFVGRGSANRLAIIDSLAPKLTIIWTGTNEPLSFPGRIQYTPTEFYDAYTKIVQRARLYGDVLMVFPQSSQFPSAFMVPPLPATQGQYERAARRVALEQDAGFFSIRQLWGDWTRHNARAYAADSYHINAAGHAVVRKMIQRVLARNS
jgi:lysophospholipase L1-like esterase